MKVREAVQIRNPARSGQRGGSEPRHCPEQYFRHESCPSLPPARWQWTLDGLLHRHCIPVQLTHAQRRKWVSRAQLVKPRPRIYEVPSHHGCGLRRIGPGQDQGRAEEHTSELQSRVDLVCRLLLEKKKRHL